MFTQQIIEQVTNQISGLLKNNPIHDFETNFRSILQSTFDKLDLVSRDEFDIQQKVLADTRAKLEKLEQIIHNLEQK